MKNSKIKGLEIQNSSYKSYLKHVLKVFRYT